MAHPRHFDFVKSLWLDGKGVSVTKSALGISLKFSLTQAKYQGKRFILLYFGADAFH